MQSMTGFGVSFVESSEFKTFISVKSVNSRFIHTKYTLSPFYASLEAKLQKEIFKTFTRGQFFIRVDRMPQTPPSSFVLKVNKTQAQKWKSLYVKISRELKVKNNLTLTDLVHQEGVVQTIEQPVFLSPSEANKVKKGFQQALKACLKERMREGRALKIDIFKQINQLKTYLKKAEKLAKQQTTQKKKSALMDIELEKLDMNEEIVRITEHVKYLQSLLKSPDSVGKKMDFYVQEIAREANTIGSKSQIPQLTQYIVEIKSLLENIKEQVRNIA